MRSRLHIVLREGRRPLEYVWWNGPDGPTRPVPASNLRPLLSCTPEVHDSTRAVITSFGLRVAGALALEIAKVRYANLIPEYVVDDVSGDSSPKRSSGHAVPAGGVREDDVGDPVPLVQNIWGHRWAASGCACLSRLYLDSHFLWGMTVGELL